MISQKSAKMLLAACENTSKSEHSPSCRTGYRMNGCGLLSHCTCHVAQAKAAIEAARQDERDPLNVTRDEFNAACAKAKADTLQAARSKALAEHIKANRETDRKARIVTDHRFVEQNGG